jgi:hypothetical protein
VKIAISLVTAYTINFLLKNIQGDMAKIYTGIVEISVGTNSNERSSLCQLSNQIYVCTWHVIVIVIVH